MVSFRSVTDKGYTNWKKDKEEREKKGLPPSTAPRNPIQYSNPVYKGRSEEDNYKWETEALKSVKGKGRSYNDKFNNLMKDAGISETEAREFRRWLDAQEDMAREVRRNKDGSISKNQTIHLGQDRMTTNITRMDDMLNKMFETGANTAKQRQQTETQKKNTQAKANETERDGILGFLDRTAGRFSNSAVDSIMSVFDPNFTQKQNENYTRNAQNKLNSGDLTKMQEAVPLQQRLNTTTREAEGLLEKGADIAGMVTGEAAKYVPSYRGANAIMKGLGVGKAGNVPKLASDLTRGAIAGGLVGTSRAFSNERADEDFDAMDWAKTIGLEAALAGGGDAAIGAVLKTLQKGSGQAVRQGITGGQTDDEIGRQLGDILNEDISSSVPTFEDPFDFIPKGPSQSVDDIVNEQFNVYNRRKLEEDAFLSEKMQPFDDIMRKSSEAEQTWQQVKQAKETAQRIKESYGKIIVPEGNWTDWGKEVPVRFRAKRGSSQGIDLYRFAEDEGFATVDDAVSFLKQIDADSKTTLSSLKPEGDLNITADQYDELLESYRQEFGKTDTAKGLDSLLDDLIQAQRENQIPRAIEGDFSVLDDLVPQQSQTPTPRDFESQSMVDEFNNGTTDLNTDEWVQTGTGSNPGSPMGVTAGRVNEYTGSPISGPQTLSKKIKDGKVSLKSTTQKLKTDLISDLQPIKDTERIIAEMDNAKVLEYVPDGSVSAKDSLFKGLRSVRRATAKAINTIDRSYKPIIENVRKAGIKQIDFEEYLLAKHADDILRNNQDKMVRAGEVQARLVDLEDQILNTNNKDALRALETEEKALLKELDTLNPYILPKEAQDPAWVQSRLDQWANNPVMQKAQQDFVKEQHLDLDILASAGVKSQAEIQAMKQAHPNYISMVRDKMDADPIFGTSANISKPRSHIKKRGLGSEEKIMSPIDSAVRNRVMAVTNAERNQAMSKIAQLAQVQGAEQFFKKANPYMENFDPSKTVKYFEDGKEVYYEVPQTLKNAFENLDNQTASNIVTDAFKAAATVIRKGSTHYNIDFILQSMFRDAQAPLVQSRTGMNPKDLVLGYMDSFFGKKIEKWSGGKIKSYVDLYNQQGGDMTGYISMDSQSISKATKDLNKGKLGKGIDVINPFKHIERLGAVTERAPKLAEMRSAKNKGYSDLDAMFEAADVIDYSDAGKFVREANKYVPFLNPAIRGNTRLLQAFKENPQKFLGKGLMYVTLPTAAVYSMRYAPTTSDEQRTKLNNLQDYQKNMFWYVPVPNSKDHELIAIPKGHLLAQVFANPLERILDKMFNDKDKSIKTMATETVKDFAKNLAPPMGIAGVSELIEAGANYDFFMEMPIEDPYSTDVRPEERTSMYTSELSKMLAEAMPDMAPEQMRSPARIDHVVKGLTGGVGRDALDTMDNIMAEFVDRPAKVNTTGQILNPFQRFLYDETNASGVYNRVFKQQQQDGWDGLEGTPAMESYDSFREINKEIKAIRENTDLTSEEKRRQIEALRKQQRQLGDDAIYGGIVQ